MDVLQVVVLSIVQGITEFLPVSSSGHLIILPKIFAWKDQGLAFDAMVHLGTVLAAALYFHKDIKDIVKGLFVKASSGRRLALGIILSMIPAVIVALLFKDWIELNVRTTTFVAVNLALWGVVLILADKYSEKLTQKKTELKEVSLKQAVIIGFAQALALLPGTSRSGITLTSGLFLGLTREAAIKFSFLMGIPIILAAGGLSLLDLIQSPEASVSLGMIFTSLIVSFLSGLAAIHFLLSVVKKRALIYFGAYRIVLALLLILL